MGRIVNGSQKNITLYDAKRINDHAPKPIFEITPKKITTFPIDPIIRNRLKRITAQSIKPLLKELGVPEASFNTLKYTTRSVTVEHAKKYNDYFRQHNLGANTPHTNVFDLERIFNLANNEKIDEKTKKLEAFIEIKPVHQEKLKELSRETYRQLIGILGHHFDQILSNTKTISIKNAVLINRISGNDIFELNEEAVQTFSILGAK